MTTDTEEKEKLRETRKRKNATILTSEFNNPCVKEHNQVYNCLNENAYNYNQCKNHTDNYKMCKEFWGRVQRDRKMKGIKPYLPDPEDREEVKKSYLPKFT